MGESALPFLETKASRHMLGCKQRAQNEDIAKSLQSDEKVDWRRVSQL